MPEDESPAGEDFGDGLKYVKNQYRLRSEIWRAVRQRQRSLHGGCHGDIKHSHDQIPDLRQAA